MKRLLLVIAFLLVPMSAMAKTYTTTFAVPENPISESGNWLNGGTCTGCGVDWNNIKTTGGYAQQAALGNTGVDDGTAVVTGTWGSDQSVTISGKKPTSLGGTQETEIRLRTTIVPNSITGYEIDFTTGGTDVVRWNGPSNNFTFIGHYNFIWTSQATPIMKSTITGSSIRSYDCSSGTCNILTDTISGTTVITDTTYSSGNPGIGIDVTIATTGSTDFGITQFTADDGADTLTFTTQPSNVVTGNAISPAVVVKAMTVGGSVDSGSSASVTVTTSACGTTQSGTATLSLSSGVGAWSNIVETGVASGCTLSAAATGLTGATSNSFNVTSGGGGGGSGNGAAGRFRRGR